ncbi:MAG: histidinol-phosphatase, partial [Calditrichaeota bacterium]|nr:histidinol-phosphatase [Calditrichota bacterium]
FGAKTQEKILENIELMKRFQDRYLISEGETAAASLYQALKDQPGVIRCEIAGSVRRRKETIG